MRQKTADIFLFRNLCARTHEPTPRKRGIDNSRREQRQPTKRQQTIIVNEVN
jgi:hypothetical protein